MPLRCRFALLLAAVTVTAAQAVAQDYPSRPIRLIVTSAAGSVSDIRARWMAERLNAALGKTIVVDNRGGAGGNIGAELAAKSPKDRIHASDRASRHPRPESAYLQTRGI